QLGKRERGRLRGAGGGGDDVLGRGPGPAEIGVRAVLEVLVRRVRVHRRHHAALDAEGLTQDLGQRDDAVGGARGVGVHAVALGRGGDAVAGNELDARALRAAGAEEGPAVRPEAVQAYLDGQAEAPSKGWVPAASQVPAAGAPDAGGPGGQGGLLAVEVTVLD